MAPPTPHELAHSAGVPAEAVIPCGRGKLKLDHRLAAPGGPPPGRLVLVTAITPTPAGEGKTVTTIGLTQALGRLGHRAACALRQPSMGPVFGVKGGGAGGGRSQVVPMEDLNLHLTGDLHAVGAAANLLAAAVDTSILLDNPERLDPERVAVRRVVDVNDRALREVRVGLGGPRNGVPRDTGFDITAASEVMSILALATDLGDLRRRLGAIVVGETFAGEPVTADQLRVAGAMAALLRDALDPNLLTTTEGAPAFVHAGPFANLSIGCSSVLADRLAARYFDFVLTEAGFGADMGAEKFVSIKCRASGLSPACAVLVATVRALKSHSGRFPLQRGAPLPAELLVEDLGALEEGCCNLDAHVELLAALGLPVVVAINRFPTDTGAELSLVRERALAAGACAAAVSEVFDRGGEGGVELAEALVAASAAGPAVLRFPYALDAPIAERLRALARGVYGAGSVEFAPRATEQVARLEALGYGELPLCVAKTQYSLSHDPQFKGRPRGFVLPVREVRLAAGAGFAVPLAGRITTMPGLGRRPAYREIDLDAEGRIVGLF